MYSLVGSPSGRTFSGTGVTGNSLNLSATSNGWSYSYTDGNGCTNVPAMDSLFIVDCTGINEVKNDAIIEMYPNPSNGLLTIRSQQELNLITIYNSLGEVVYRAQTSNKQESVDISGNAAGIYFVRIDSSLLKLIIE